ncbi:MAG: hypothetical protein ATN35_03885 [Epulopiscium sp. Nele67-Bin004]|nr:MAG: hypothetical protein ATN35_03885 [Epulopiscium sp. Nele67-Bin004]
MKGLIKSNLYVISNNAVMILKGCLAYTLAYVALMLIFPTYQYTFFYGFIMSIVLGFVIIPWEAISKSNQSNWDMFSVTLPISRKEIVLSNYVTFLICSCLGIIIGLLIGLSMSMFLSEVDATKVLSIVSAGFIYIFLTPAIVYPLIFMYGTSRIEVIHSLALVTVTVVFMIAIETNIAMGVLISMLAFILSCFLSVKVFENKDL